MCIRDSHREIGQRLTTLQQLERENCSSLDRMADQFAMIMTAMVPTDRNETSRRVLEQLLYHLGRWIYLIDAWDDLDEDLAHGRYNPVACRYQFSTASTQQAKDQTRQSLERTVSHSENLAISAFHLGEFGYHAPLEMCIRDRTRGDRKNLKITTQFDLVIGEAIAACQDAT